MLKKINFVISDILDELKRAEEKYPDYPTDLIHQSAIVAEESGELVRACLNHVYHGESKNECIKEAIQTGAMAIRFLLNNFNIED